MPDNSSNTKRIAKNTVFLYIRMIVILVINLYTSRIVLQLLGVEDFGIYNVVGGIVTFLSFLNAALSNGSSRFITFEMGKKEGGNVHGVFQSSFIAHVILAFIIVVLAETGGIWFLYNKLVIPPDRIEAAVFAYHCSIITSLVTITQVPYTALIISNENMGIYAYVSILEAVLKLSVVFLLLYSPIDKLKYYAILLCVVQISIAMIYRFYCVRKYRESSLHNLKADWRKIKEIVSFSSWSLFGNASHALNGQGLTIITNIFFSPAVVAARALSVQVNNAAMNLIQNLITAANPQIVKLYASGEQEKSRNLMLNTTRYSFLMMLLLSVPLICACDEIMRLWLVAVPKFTVIFVRLILIQSLFFTFDTCFYNGLYACGRVKQNAIISPSLYVLQFIVTYFLFELGFSPIALSVVGILTSAVAGILVKPFLLKRLAGCTYTSVYAVITRCLIAALIALPVPLYLMYSLSDGWTGALLKASLGFLISLVVAIFVGINSEERKLALNYVAKKFR